jgi:hypothetical protein
VGGWVSSCVRPRPVLRSRPPCPWRRPLARCAGPRLVIPALGALPRFPGPPAPCRPPPGRGLGWVGWVGWCSPSPSLARSPGLPPLSRHHKVGAEGPEHRTIPYGRALTSSETLPAIGWRYTHRDEMNISAPQKRDCPPSRQPSSWITLVSGWGSGGQNAVPNDQARRQVGPHLTTARAQPVACPFWDTDLRAPRVKPLLLFTQSQKRPELMRRRTREPFADTPSRTTAM